MRSCSGRRARSQRHVPSRATTIVLAVARALSARLSQVLALLAIAVAITAADIALVVICWKTRTVLGGLLGAISLGLVALAIVSGPARGRSDPPLAGAGVALGIGAALYGIGHALQRLLDDEPSESTSGRR